MWLIEVERGVRLAKGSRLAAACSSLETSEEYQCRFGLDEAWRARLEGGALTFTAFDEQGHVRGAELRGHPFFVATLFQPERSALRGASPALYGPVNEPWGVRRFFVRDPFGKLGNVLAHAR